MCVALYPMEYDALRAEAAVLCDQKPGVQKAAERKCVTLKSLCAVVAPGRKGLMFCFLLLLLFDQNRVEVVQPLWKSASFLGFEWATIRKSEWMRLW
jgi:hypothetical protein